LEDVDFVVSDGTPTDDFRQAVATAGAVLL